MILLTGATGMIGAHIAFTLTKSGKKLRAIRRKGSSIAATEKIFRFYSEEADRLLSLIEWVEADLLDMGALEDAFEGITHVYHAAAIVSFLPDDRQKLLEANIEGTANIVNLALDYGVKKFCHISSVASLGRTTDGTVIDENIWWKTSPENSWYAISKYGAEREVWRATEEGLDVVILNPSLVLGPGDGERSSSALFSLLKKGTSWYTEGITGYVDARDVADAAVKLMESEIRNERFILNAINLTYKEIFDKILLQFGNKATRFRAGSFLLGLGWRLEKLFAGTSGRNPRITRETASASLKQNRFSGNKITERMDFRYRLIDDSIRELAAFYK